MIETILKEALSKDSFLKNIYNGVFARNELPTLIDYPAAIILNTKPRSHAGEHWLAIFFDKNKNGYFFDSYGQPPIKFGLEKYMDKMSINWYYNKKRIQGLSSFCGYYCLLFLFLIVRKKLNIFYKNFTNNIFLNDRKIDFLIKKYKN